jgi:hypothetical protein
MLTLATLRKEPDGIYRWDLGVRSHFNISQLLVELANISHFGTYNLELVRAKDNVCVEKASN